MQSGDRETADKLREQLRAMHKENVQQRQEDFENLQSSRRELKEDIQKAHQERRGEAPGPQGPEGGYRHYPPREFREGERPRDLRKDHRDKREDVRDRREDVRDRREDRRDRKEDVLDRKEDIRDRREDVRDRREDAWDVKHNAPVGTEAWKRDKMEDRRDRREDIADRREDKRDRREDRRDQREDRRDLREDKRERKEDKWDKKHGMNKTNADKKKDRGLKK
jgi:hypothetical protein